MFSVLAVTTVGTRARGSTTGLVVAAETAVGTIIRDVADQFLGPNKAEFIVFFFDFGGDDIADSSRVWYVERIHG